MRITRRAAIKAFVATSIGGGAAVVTYGAAYERHQIGLTRATLPVTGLPPALDGLRIGLITDIHHSRLVPAEDVLRAIELTMAAEPDLIVLGGDYVSFADRAFVDPVAELLASLRAPHGVFAILGNHDDERDMPVALARKGFDVLVDQRTERTIRGQTLQLAGLRFWTRRDSSALESLVEEAPGTTLLLAHDPRWLSRAARLGVPAVLSGHTHGGQVVLPVIGAVSRRRFPVVYGLGFQDDTSIFVSRGVGTVYVPIRLNCPPEVALVTLARRSHA